MSKPVKRGVSRQQIIACIREKIVNGTYPPGSPLLQDAIAAESGVSKIPVREALVQLHAEGLVNLNHRGFQVKPLSPGEVEEVMRLRLQIEPLAAAEGARRAQPVDREAARGLVERLRGTMDAGELTGVPHLNHSFHLALVVPRLQPATAEILACLHARSLRYICLQLQPQGRVTRANREHDALYEAWYAGQTAAVSRLTALHIENTWADLALALEPRPDPSGMKPVTQAARPRFHLAFPVRDLTEARAFYGGLLGCPEGRSSPEWVDFDFHGHQIVAHLAPPQDASAVNPVDGENVPVRHFGVILTLPEWERLTQRLREAQVRFLIEPQVRFQGGPGEQATCFFLDPSGNAIELKAFADDSMVFAT